MKKLILLVVLMMSGMCFANTKQCNALIKRVDPLMREYLKMTWAGHAMDTQTLIKDYGNMDNAGSRVIMNYGTNEQNVCQNGKT